MSDANRVEVLMAPETVFNEIPPSSTNWQSQRLTSEDLSGTPTTTESVEVRNDRIPSSLAKVGFESVGGIDIEWSHTTYDDLILAAMCDTGWQSSGRSTINAADASATMTAATKTISGTTDWYAAGLRAGMTVVVGGFADPANTGSFLIGDVNSVTPTNLVLVSPNPLADEVGVSITVDWIVPTNEEQVVVGVVDRSYSIEKQYEDATAFLMLSGCRVGEMMLDYQYQQILTGRFAFRGARAQTGVTTFVPGGAVIDPKTTTLPLNASSDVAALVMDGKVQPGLVVQQMQINLNNNLRDVTGIGSDFPLDINKGRALIEGTVNMYMSPLAWSMYEKGLSMTRVAISARTLDAAGYGLEIVLPNCMLTGPAPPTQGIDTDVMYQAQLRAEYDATLGTHMLIRRHDP